MNINSVVTFSRPQGLTTSIQIVPPTSVGSSDQVREISDPGTSLAIINDISSKIKYDGYIYSTNPKFQSPIQNTRSWLI